MLIPVLCGSLWAQELKTPGEQVLAELKAALLAEDARAAVRLLGEVGGLYRYPAGPEEAAALLDLAGRAAGHKDAAIAAAALRALGETGAPRAAEWIKPLLRAKGARALAAVRAAGWLRSASLVAPLAELAKAPDLVLAGEALLALGEYARAPTDLRRRVAEKALALCASAQRNRKRWRHLRPPGLRALQRLMGRRLNRVEQFEDWWRFAKSRKDPFAPPAR